jgi:hypothetical protein
MKRLPGLVYEPLPYLYLLIGISAFSACDSWLGYLCSLMLISAGAYILKLRLDYRAPHQVMLRELAGDREAQIEPRPSQINRRPQSEADHARMVDALIKP